MWNPDRLRSITPSMVATLLIGVTSCIGYRLYAADTRSITRAAESVETSSQGGVSLSLSFPDEVIDTWHGYERHRFLFHGQHAWVVCPKTVVPERPWSWCMMFPDAFPQRCCAPQLLKAGFHHVYLNVGNTFGCPKAIEQLAAFQKELMRRGLARKASLIGISRGGLYALRYANEYPDNVRVIYGDNPVCDFKSWPGGKGTGKGSPRDWLSCMKLYGFKTESEAMLYSGNPVDSLLRLVNHNIAMIHVIGEQDKVVPPSENALLVEARYKKLGGTIVVIKDKEKGHHPHGLEDPSPVVNFIVQQMTTLPE